jgi:hypothetical protein
MDEKAAPDILVYKEDIITAVTAMAKRQVRSEQMAQTVWAGVGTNRTQRSLACIMPVTVAVSGHLG